MSAGQRKAFRQRALTLFGTDPNVVDPEPPLARRTPQPTIVPRYAPSAVPLVLVVGITVDADERGVARVSALLEDLLSLQRDPRVAGCNVVLLENGPGAALRARVDALIHRGLRCYVADSDRQSQDAQAGFFGVGFTRRPGRLGISESRAMVQRYVHHMMRPGSVGWILDDDKRLAPLVHEGGRLARRDYDLVAAIERLRAAGPEIVLGVDTGAAPLPAVATLRTQLVDLAANLAAMRALGPDAVWPDGSAENVSHASSAPDYYHDLSRAHTWHLELPFWFCPDQAGVDVRESFQQMACKAPRIFAGEQVFRPLFVEAQRELTLQPSVRRGGSTLVFDANALIDVPQVVPATNGRPARRSDMVWALLNVHWRGRRVEEAQLPVFHDRSSVPDAELDISALVDDVRGYALYSTIRDVAERRPNLDGLSDADCRFASKRHHKYLVERSAACVLSFHRARGAARTVRAIATDPAAWWQTEPRAPELTAPICALADRVMAALKPEVIIGFQAAVGETSPLDLRQYFHSLRAQVDALASQTIRPPAWLELERVRIAQAQIERLAEPTGPLELLGAGQEGVVFTDGRLVFKYLDLWRTRSTSESRAFLRAQIGAWPDAQCLYPLRRLVEQEQDAILSYAYEPSQPYSGGHGAGLVHLLRELQAHGVACRNLHPRNLRVVKDRVRLIDYGADLVPLDQAEWRQMLRRAWLSWRWTHLPELDQLMRRALREEPPELNGWERLDQAVQAPNAKLDADALTIEMVPASGPARVLDYGCGAGETVHALAKRGMQVVGFDVVPDPRWQVATGASFTTDRELALAGARRDVVVCALVLCTLDDSAYRRALEDIRGAVRDEGTVVLSVCNPFHTQGGDTPFQERCVAHGSDPDRAIPWTKRVRGTGRERHDVHRPLHVLTRDLMRAGLNVESATETATVDLDRLEPASDFIVLRARAMPAGPKVSLLVRTSAMEWRTLALQVRHVVEQLEGPTPFYERIVVLDSRRARFLRQYDEADYEAARAVLLSLLADRVIDRIVFAPEGEDVADLTERWFGLRAADAHSASGAPIASSLTGIEACSGDYILHVDDDLLVARRDRDHDYLAEMVEALQADPKAVCSALNICQAEDQEWSTADGRGPWRVEVRCTLLHGARLRASRPWPNELDDGALRRSWHRALDARIQAGGLHSLRGGRASTFFVHPPNDAKRDRDAWLAILDRMEAGIVPHTQIGQVELHGSLSEWLRPERHEELVIVACGRNVPAGRVARFRASLEAQTEQDFGLVIVEDGGARVAADAVRRQFTSWSNASILTLRERRGALANIVWALRYMCTNPTSIVVLIDLDDALLGSETLRRIREEFEQGADLAVGGMRRTDKAASYPVDFERPRERRGGNVWQHLRCFRRELFDRVPDEALRLDGEYVDLAWDWALLLPLVELASAPRYVDESLYLHEPSGTGKNPAERRIREDIIARIVAKPSLRRGGV